VPDRGPNWERQADGSVLYRASRSTPAVELNETAFGQIRTVVGREILISVFTGVPVAALFVIWLFHGEWLWVLLCAVVAYVALNQLVHLLGKRRRADILAGASPARRGLDLSWARTREVYFAGCSDRALVATTILLFVLAVISVVLVARSTLGIIWIPAPTVRPLAALWCLAVFSPLFIVFLREYRRRRRLRLEHGR
jgi:hypothetical protein